MSRAIKIIEQIERYEERILALKREYILLSDRSLKSLPFVYQDKKRQYQDDTNSMFWD